MDRALKNMILLRTSRVMQLVGHEELKGLFNYRDRK